ncbi:MAG: hypothetical protein HQL39_17875, partial [Alphaproteobacteria bacterium]|nr:hypothetical protein [Alphaproteobacteria bacterium]
MTRLALIHGWGFDASFWRSFRLPGVETVTVDLGFQGAPFLPNFRPDDIAVGHSLGFLWALRHGPWRAAISINGFPRFVAGCDFPFGVARR